MVAAATAAEAEVQATSLFVLGADAARRMQQATYDAVDEVGRAAASEGIDAGFHKGIAMSFDYEHPPVPPPLGLKDWAMKRLLNRVYWMLVPAGRV